MTFRRIQPQVLDELLVRCGRGDEDAFAQHYRLTSPFVYAVVSRRLRSQAEAETALVQIYVTVWRTASSYVVAGSPSGWTWTLAIMDRTLVERSTDIGSTSRMRSG